jgi:cardiolipin synthase
MIVDREWCTVGSTNFDPRSFRINDEISVAIYDRGVAESSRGRSSGMCCSEEWTVERWQARSLGHQVRDRLSVLARRQL